MQKMTIYDMIILQQHFANKKKPTAKDKELAKKLDGYLTTTADTMVYMTCTICAGLRREDDKSHEPN